MPEEIRIKGPCGRYHTESEVRSMLGRINALRPRERRGGRPALTPEQRAEALRRAAAGESDAAIAADIVPGGVSPSTIWRLRRASRTARG